MIWKNKEKYTGDLKIILASDDIWETYKMFHLVLQSAITEEQKQVFLKLRQKFINCEGVKREHDNT